MTCCILAALVIGQIFAFRDRIRHWLGLPVEELAGKWTSPSRWRQWRGVALAASLVVGAGLAAYHKDHLLGLFFPEAKAYALDSSQAVCTVRSARPSH